MSKSEPRDRKPVRSSTPSEIERARASYARRAWGEAFAALERADAEAPLAPADLERLAWSAGLAGRDDVLLRTNERLYHAQLEAGEHEQAARWAFWTGFRLHALGEHGRSSAWLARAQRALELLGRDSVIQGYLLLPATQRSIMAGELDAACAAGSAALAIGERFLDADLMAFSRSILGRALVRHGEREKGLALLDEAMLAGTSGELSPLVTGLIYCSVIASCQQVYAFERAREWTAGLSDFCAAQPELVLFNGVCGVHRAEIMQLEGAWPEAIDAARRVSTRENRSSEGTATANALYQEAEIYRLRGEFSAAEASYRAAHDLGRDPQPGLALLRLTQGRGEAAIQALRRVLGPCKDPLQRTRFLPAYVEIALALDLLDEARGASDELAAIARDFASDALGAIVAHTHGAVLLGTGEAEAALDPLRRALHVWQQLGAPYIAARIRTLLARACRALGDEDSASLELGAAREVFERLGAAPDLVALDAAPAAAQTPGAHGLSPRELEVLRLVACGKTNKVIARELHLSEKTIDRHVSNIFGKLDVSSRAAATAYAYEHALIG